MDFVGKINFVHAKNTDSCLEKVMLALINKLDIPLTLASFYTQILPQLFSYKPKNPQVILEPES